MFEALAVGVFFALWVWVRRRSGQAAVERKRLRGLLEESLRDLETAELRSERIIGLLNEWHARRAAPTGRASWNELAQFTMQTVGPLVKMEAAVLLKWEPAFADFRGVAASGVSPEQLAALKVRHGEGVLGRAVEGQKSLVLETLADSPALPHESFLSAPCLIFPLRLNQQVNGLLVFCRPESGFLAAEQTRLATLIAKQIEAMLENLYLYEDRQRVYEEVVEALVRALSVKAPGSREHMSRCRSLVRAMAQEMHLPAALTQQFEYGAVLHDIGKLGIEDSILFKTSALTDEEYALMKKHPSNGYELLRPITFLKAIAPIVLYHQEWVNGQGYPEGLAGEEIPLGARMVGIAEAWDTMTSDQPYRKALPANSAIAELRQQAGTQFDPKLVDIFLRIVDRLEHAESKAPASLAGGN